MPNNHALCHSYPNLLFVFSRKFIHTVHRTLLSISRMAAKFAARNKAHYIQAVESGKGKDWTVVMGNEAGDLDTVSSALAYAWMQSEIHQSLTVPLQQTLRSDLHLRAENQYALSIAGFESSKRELLCIDDLAKFSPFPSNRFALVDHNRLSYTYSNEHPDATVVAIVDHHKDEGLYRDTAEPRLVVVPTGSCSSLVATIIEKQCPENIQIPQDLATLLLCSILIDTNGLKPGGKAEKIDIQAATYLLPRSTLASSLPSNILLNSPSSSAPPRIKDEVDLHDVPTLSDLTNTLHEKKSSVSHLGTRDLLRRDYKEYSLTPSWDSSSPIKVGLASVPIGLKPWTARDLKFWDVTGKWMAERNLAAVGILTSFRDEMSAFRTKAKGERKREMLMVVDVNAAKGKLFQKLHEGLEESEELQLENFRQFGAKVEGGFAPSVKARAYKQKNLDATRKVVAPLVQIIVEGVS